MRDLKRTNAKEPAYKLLESKKVEVFVPMQWQVLTQNGKRIRRQVPFMQDLLFVHETRAILDPIVEKTPTLQYRWLRNTFREPMTVNDGEMERFIQVVGNSETPKYYLPNEITPKMYGRRIRIVGGPLDNYEGSLLTTQGSKAKRLFVELKGLLGVSIEVNPEFIEML